jgi:hypothetical protein
MVNRCSVAFLILGVMAGYLITGTTVRAQIDPLPFAVGDTVTLRFGAPWSTEYNNFISCTVSDIRGLFVKCAPPLPSERSGRPEQWYNLQQSVAMIEKAK